MPPQSPLPLSKVSAVAGIALGPGALPARPHLAALVAQVIAFWSEVDLQRGRYLGALLGGGRNAAVAMYLAITSAAARRAALDAASKAVLSEGEYELFSRIMRMARAAEKARNAFAHGLWGYSEEIPNGLLLVDSEYRLKNMLRLDTLMQQMRDGKIQWPVDSIDLDRSRIMVYRERDLLRSLGAVSGIHRLTYYLAGLPSLQGQAREQLHLRLLGELSPLQPWP